MPALLIADIDVTDPETYEAYKQANPDIVNTFGGRYVSIGLNSQVLEGDWVPHRTVLIEFPSMDMVERFYNSDAYKALRKIRWKSASSRLIAFETFDEPRDRP